MWKKINLNFECPKKLEKEEGKVLVVLSVKYVGCEIRVISQLNFPKNGWFEIGRFRELELQKWVGPHFSSPPKNFWCNQ